MPLKAVALKKEGTHSPSEGVLARFAQVREIGSLRDLEAVKQGGPDLILMDLHMPPMNGKEVVEELHRSRKAPVVVLIDSQAQPAALLKQLNALSSLRAARAVRPLSLSRIIRLLGLSQETFSRIVNVSARTAHRWLKGSQPRRTRELDRLFEIAALLQQTLPDEEEIRRYLYQSSPALGGERPIELLLRREFDRVAADLEAVQEGVYV